MYIRKGRIFLDLKPSPWSQGPAGKVTAATLAFLLVLWTHQTRPTSRPLYSLVLLPEMISPKLLTQLASSLNSTLSQMWYSSRGLSWPRHVTEHLCFISVGGLLSIWHSTFTYLCITGTTKRDKTLCLLLKQCLTYNKSSIDTFFFFK